MLVDLAFASKSHPRRRLARGSGRRGPQLLRRARLPGLAGHRRRHADGDAVRRLARLPAGPGRALRRRALSSAAHPKMTSASDAAEARRLFFGQRAGSSAPVGKAWSCRMGGLEERGIGGGSSLGVCSLGGPVRREIVHCVPDSVVCPGWCCYQRSVWTLGTYCQNAVFKR